MGMEEIVLVGGIVYIIFWFGVVEFFKCYMVYWGMWYSFFVVIIVVMCVFLICLCEDMWFCLFKVGVVFFGFMLYFVLDEFYFVDFKCGVLWLKKLVGMVFKFWSCSNWVNFLIYFKLIVFVVVVFNDLIMMK